MTPLKQIDNLNNIPQALKEIRSWVGFKVEGGKKIPYIADEPHRNASSMNPKTWRTYEAALEGLKRGDFNAIGYALNGDFIGVDLDHCFDGNRLKPYAAEIVNRFQSYAETSFSGTGIHILAKGSWGKGHRTPEVEIYGRGRFFICTGNHLTDTPKDIQSSPDAVQWLLGDQYTEKAEKAEITEAISSPLSVLSVYSLPELIDKTLPRRPGERNFKLFDFARGLRFNLGMGGCRPKELKTLVRQWYDAAHPNIRTKDFDSTWADFNHAWSRTQFPLGTDLLTVAWEKSRAEPLPAAAGDYDSESVKQLIGLCAALASLFPDKTFFLSTHSAGRLLHKTPRTILSWMRMLIADELIELTRKGNERMASRYRWIAEPEPTKTQGEA